MGDYKEETKKAYDLFTNTFERKFEDHFYQNLDEVREFLNRLPKNSKILDIGCAAGTHALYFQNQNHEVFCIDISEEMIKRCREKGLKAEVMDFENLIFPRNSFDGIWAYTSLVHSPKEKLDDILKQISHILKPEGIFFLGTKKGEDEGFRIQDKYPGTKRWFSLFSDKEIRDYLKPHFQVIFHSEKKVDDNHTFLHYILRKKTF